jgi:Rps23 Pro-64 3,4-dihydroxylase Tpa1-like proline 4-hydroxylase
MKFEYYEEPTPHIIVHDYFNKEELAKVWQELEFLTYSEKLLPPDMTGSARNSNKQIIKNNYGLFLDDIYPIKSISNILTVNRKLFDLEFAKKAAEHHFIFNYILNSNQDSTLVSYYEENDCYFPHTDTTVLTAIINFYKEPLQFTGGDLMLGSENNIIPVENNRLVLFPGCAMHAVTPVKFINPQPPFSGMGRYTISQFINVSNLKYQANR